MEISSETYDGKKQGGESQGGVLDSDLNGRQDENL